MNQIPNCYYRLCVKAFVLNEDRSKFLLVKDDAGNWDLPGGGLDWGESPEEGIIREIQEEMGLEVLTVASQPKYFFPIVKGEVRYAYPIYETTFKNFNFKSTPECVEIRFVSIEEAASLQCRPNIPLFLRILQDHPFN